jgi:peroxiredoxin
MRCWLIALCLLLICWNLVEVGKTGWAETAPLAAKLGMKIDNFTLPDSDGKSWSLADGKDNKAAVVVFLGTECPVNNAYQPRLVEMHKEYAGKGVRFVAVNSNSQDTQERVAAHARKYGLPFPVLKDPDQIIADRFGARRTPEAFVLDADFKVRYQGRIDDQFGIGYNRPRATRTYLADAISEVLAGTTVSQPMTVVEGCLIARTVKTKPEGTVTYTKQVARILQNKCQECHRPKQIGPMSLLTYEDANSWSEMIREVVKDNRMPPWHADSRYGHFQNDRRLAQEEKETLLTWIDQGCARGKNEDLPAPKQFAEGWRIGKPDVVFTVEREYRVPAKAPARGVPYQYFMVATNFNEDRWIQAAEARPGNYAVVHHIIVYVVKPGERPQNHEDRIGNGFLVGEAPGDMPAVFEPGMAKKLPRGGLLVFQVHYTPNGVEQTDRSSVGLIFAKEPPKYEVRTRGISTNRFAIPPGEANYKVVSRSIFQKNALLLSFMPHMHLRGKSFQYRLITPDSKEEILMGVPRYDFSWQSNYRLERPIKLPAGSRIECTAYFDNSPGNLNNPDPTKEVRWGDQTWQEMMIGFVDYVYTDGQ